MIENLSTNDVIPQSTSFFLPLIDSFLIGISHSVVTFLSFSVPTLLLFWYTLSIADTTPKERVLLKFAPIIRWVTIGQSAFMALVLMAPYKLLEFWDTFEPFLFGVGITLLIRMYLDKLTPSGITIAGQGRRIAIISILLPPQMLNTYQFMLDSNLARVQVFPYLLAFTAIFYVLINLSVYGIVYFIESTPVIRFPTFTFQFGEKIWPMSYSTSKKLIKVNSTGIADVIGILLTGLVLQQALRYPWRTIVYKPIEVAMTREDETSARLGQSLYTVPRLPAPNIFFDEDENDPTDEKVETTDSMELGFDLTHMQIVPSYMDKRIELKGAHGWRRPLYDFATTLISEKRLIAFQRAEKFQTFFQTLATDPKRRSALESQWYGPPEIGDDLYEVEPTENETWYQTNNLTENFQKRYQRLLKRYDKVGKRLDIYIEKVKADQIIIDDPRPTPEIQKELRELRQERYELNKTLQELDAEERVLAKKLKLVREASNLPLPFITDYEDSQYIEMQEENEFPEKGYENSYDLYVTNKYVTSRKKNLQKQMPAYFKGIDPSVNEDVIFAQENFFERGFQRSTPFPYYPSLTNYFEQLAPEYVGDPRAPELSEITDDQIKLMIDLIPIQSKILSARLKAKKDIPQFFPKADAMYSELEKNYPIQMEQYELDKIEFLKKQAQAALEKTILEKSGKKIAKKNGKKNGLDLIEEQEPLPPPPLPARLIFHPIEDQNLFQPIKQMETYVLAMFEGRTLPKELDRREELINEIQTIRKDLGDVQETWIMTAQRIDRGLANLAKANGKPYELSSYEAFEYFFNNYFNEWEPTIKVFDIAEGFKPGGLENYIQRNMFIKSGMDLAHKQVFLFKAQNGRYAVSNINFFQRIFGNLQTLISGPVKKAQFYPNQHAFAKKMGVKGGKNK